MKTGRKWKNENRNAEWKGTSYKQTQMSREQNPKLKEMHEYIF